MLTFAALWRAQSVIGDYNRRVNQEFWSRWLLLLLLRRSILNGSSCPFPPLSPGPEGDSQAAWLRLKQTDLVPGKGQFRSCFPIGSATVVRQRHMDPRNGVAAALWFQRQAQLELGRRGRGQNEGGAVGAPRQESRTIVGGTSALAIANLDEAASGPRPIKRPESTSSSSPAELRSSRLKSCRRRSRSR